MLFLCHPTCTTCKKARKWMKDHHIAYTERSIKDERPTEKELKEWHKLSGLPLKRFFNTSGMGYRSLGLKDKLPTMPMEEQIALLASDGMLVKRPLLISEGFVLVGFKEKEWAAQLGTK